MSPKTPQLFLPKPRRSLAARVLFAPLAAAIFLAPTLLATAEDKADAPKPTAAKPEPAAKNAKFTAADGLAFVRTYCHACHNEKKKKGKLDLTPFDTVGKITADTRGWLTILDAVRDTDMPPQEADKHPDDESRQAFSDWLRDTLRSAAAEDGISPGPAPLRRLNRTEYANTLRDLLGIQINAAHALPDDGAGGEGFDNAASTLFISPIHAEKYLEAAESALKYAAKDPRTHRNIFATKFDTKSSPRDISRKIFSNFLPKAFRRPVKDYEIETYLKLFDAAHEKASQGKIEGQKDKKNLISQGESAAQVGREEAFEEAILYALRGALVSPYFLFRLEGVHEGAAEHVKGEVVKNKDVKDKNAQGEGVKSDDVKGKNVKEKLDPQRGPRLVGGYEMASRLSYFLWASMPDEELFRLAEQGKLNEPETLKRQVERMLGDRRNRHRGFAESFIEQWLGTRELGRAVKPDRGIHRGYDGDLEAVIKYEPVLFFEEILEKNRSLLELIDADYTYLNNQLARHYRLRIKDLREQPVRVDLPKDSHRGGVVTMAATLAVSSFPHRTSPVLRGKWVLETILGTPPPPPPANVPELEEHKKGEAPTTLRERLMKHRENPTCASCHNRMDPIGFGLERFDAVGRYRTQDAGRDIDVSGTLPDGTSFTGEDELKAVLLKQKDKFIHHLTAKMLGYALGRGLVNEDYWTVDQIAGRVEGDGYRAQTMIKEIVLSIPFRYRAGTDPDAPVEGTRVTAKQE